MTKRYRRVHTVGMGKPDKMSVYTNVVLYVKANDPMAAKRCLDEALEHFQGKDLSDILDWIRDDLQAKASPFIKDYLTERRARVGAPAVSQLDAVEAKLHEWG